MRRREFITLFGGAAAWPLAARAQQVERVRRIGALIPLPQSDPEARAGSHAFERRLRDLGWSEGRNLQINYRYTTLKPDELRTSAAELVGLQPDVIVARTTPATAALVEETQTVPIVFVNVADPIGSRFAQSLPRPGANLTGFTPFEPELGGKWLELLHELVPSLSRAAVLYNPRTAPYAEPFLHTFRTAASSMGVEARTALVERPSDIEPILIELARLGAAGLVALPDSFSTMHRDIILMLTTQPRVPSIYPFRYFAAFGGLASYGVNTTDELRRAAGYVDRILRGAKPADLPVQAPTKYELVVNLKAAKAIGLDISPLLLSRADEVIE